ncbi:hypothetical protein GJ743_07595 [Agromyces bracchium]|uniref:Uncharacterized protein n=1 Tax=Agromyces bracchium TaxID=88376 RepID=A0A6I3M0M8_9MICO|nr:hypothetical protein [Agromyces bracchium]
MHTRSMPRALDRKLMEVADSSVFPFGGRIHVTTRARATSEAQARGAASRRRSQRNFRRATYRSYGISRQVHNKWRRRFDEEGYEGVKYRSGVPHHQPTNNDPA